MKITIISKMFGVFALCVSLMSFSSTDQTKTDDKNQTETVKLKASVMQIGVQGYKVKLAVDKGTDETLRVYLKDFGGNTLYSEVFSKKEDKYRRIFDLADMTDGTYYFELYHNKQKLTKEVQLETTRGRAISFR